MIRKATAADLPGVEAIYNAILDREEQGPVYTNWQRGKYPTADTARAALEAGTLYVGEEGGALWGVVNLNGDQLPEYDAIPWSIPDRSGRGLARELAAFCEAECRRQGKAVIRLDTWEGNLPANRLYPSIGYRYAGAAEFFFMGFIHETLNCYEKLL